MRRSPGSGPRTLRRWRVCSGRCSLCAPVGVLRRGLVAIDGTKLVANASRDANRTAAQLAEQIVAEAAAVDAVEDAAASAAGEEVGELPDELRSRVVAAEATNQSHDAPSFEPMITATKRQPAPRRRAAACPQGRG